MENGFVIDKIKNIIVDSDRYATEVTTMTNLRTGLIFLYNIVYPIEQEIVDKYEDRNIYFFGRSHDLPNHIFEMLPCFYHWFGTSIVNYARLAGMIVGYEENEISTMDLTSPKGKEKIKNFCDQYILSINELSEIVKWRNKVGAHFALTDPRKSDNVATLEASIIYPISFCGSRFKTGGIKFCKIESGSPIDAEIPQWSLTEIFEIISGRFWPNIIFNKKKDT